MEEKIKKIKKIANNVLYFDDNSDYRSALWEILMEIDPNTPNELDFIDD